MADIKKQIGAFLGSLLVIFAVILTILPIPIVAYSNYPLSCSDTEIASALDYLRNNQTIQGDIGGFATSAWVTMAIAAGGEDPHTWKVGSNPSIVDYLETHAGNANVSIAPDVARMILAIVAAGESPTDFGGINFVDALKTLYDDGQIGDTSLLNDDFWGVMALISAGESLSSEIIANSVGFIKNNQNDDGGWSWAINQSSDVDDTACAVMALIAAGESSGSNAIVNSLNYIKSQQADNGGFLSWGATNPSTDSWAIDAIVAAGQNPTSSYWTKNNNASIDDLLGFQNLDGSFPDWQGNPSPWITAYAIPALLGKPYPVEVLQPQAPGSVYVRVEGQSSTVWSGDVTVTESDITADNSGTTYHLSDPTALGALDEASNHEERFSYYVTDEYGGLYAKSIAGEQPSGANGWMYRVDYYSTSVGADQFILAETTPPATPHEEVLFYYGAWTDLPLKISVNKTAVAKGEEFSVMVSVYNDTAHDWSACENATVYADHDYTTGSDGEVNITIDRDGTFKLFAEKSGCIRSDKVSVKVGTGVGSQAQVSLSVTITPAISVEVTPDSIDFGDLAPGYTSDACSITIENKGGMPVTVTVETTDQAQGLFTNGLKLDNNSWRLFGKTINANDNLETQAKLAVPLDYAGVGTKTGTLIFWAEES